MMTPIPGKKYWVSGASGEHTFIGTLPDGMFVFSYQSDGPGYPNMKIEEYKQVIPE